MTNDLTSDAIVIWILSRTTSREVLDMLRGERSDLTVTLAALGNMHGGGLIVLGVRERSGARLVKPATDVDCVPCSLGFGGPTAPCQRLRSRSVEPSRSLEAQRRYLRLTSPKATNSPAIGKHNGEFCDVLIKTL